MTNLLLLTLLSCEKDQGADDTAPPTSQDDTAPPDADDTGDSGDSAEPVDADIGVLVLLHWPEDRWFAESVITHGVLSSDERWRDPLDPIAYLHDLGYDTWLDWGMWPIPEADALVDIDHDTPTWDPADLATLDGGERILIGDDWEVYRTTLKDGLVVYLDDPEDTPPTGVFEGGGEVALSLDGGDDLGAQDSLASAVVPEPLDLDLALTDMHVVGPDEAVTLTWTPTASADDLVLITAGGDAYGYSWQVDEDEGSVTIEADFLQDLGGDFLAVTAARMVETEVQLPEGRVLVRAYSESWVSFVQVESLGFWPTTAFQDTTSTLEIYDAEGRLADITAVDLGEGLFVEAIEVESDTVAKLTLLVDEDAPTGPHDVTVTAGGETFGSASTMMVYESLPKNDTCDDAGTGPAMSDGYAFTDLAGLSDQVSTHTCYGFPKDLPGNDSWHRIDVEAGQQVNISAVAVYGDVALALYDSCSGEPIACYDDEEGDSVEVLNEDVDEDGTWYVVVDSAYELDQDEVYLYTEVIWPADLSFNSWGPAQGESIETTVRNRLYDWDGSEVTWITNGDDLTITANEVDEDDPALLHVTMTADADAEPGFRILGATQGGVTGWTDDEKVGVAKVLEASATCAEADGVEPLTAGLYRGETIGKSGIDVDNEACLGWDAEGPEAVYRFELGGEGHSATASVQAEFDHAIYYVSACDGGAPAECLDDADAGDIETLSRIAGAGEAGTWYLVVDGAYAEEQGAFTIHLLTDEGGVK